MTHMGYLYHKTFSEALRVAHRAVYLDRANLSDSTAQAVCKIYSAMYQTGGLGSLIELEREMFAEYQRLDYAVYRSMRLAELQQISSLPESSLFVTQLQAYVQAYRPSIAVYAGSFDPFHLGHLNILQKAENIFDKVIIARGQNPDKSQKHTDISCQQLQNRQIESFSGFTTDYISSKEHYSDVTLIRGLRNGYDLDYEVNQLRFMEELKANLKVIFIFCDREYEHISSSTIKSLQKINPQAAARYIA